MPMAKKTAIEKLNADKEIKIVDSLPDGIPWAKAGSSMVVSTPKEVNAIMRKIPEGKIATLDTLREALRLKYKTDVACPMSTGIFVNIASAAAEEMRTAGENDITPWWRTIKNDGSLNPKAPAGAEGHKTQLEKEGFAFTSHGKKIRVENFEGALIKPESLIA